MKSAKELTIGVAHLFELMGIVHVPELIMVWLLSVTCGISLAMHWNEEPRELIGLFGERGYHRRSNHFTEDEREAESETVTEVV